MIGGQSITVSLVLISAVVLMAHLCFVKECCYALE